MAKIFKENKIKELVAKIPSSDLMDKIEIAKRWHNDYHNGSLKVDKETSREQAFNQDFFVKILGYAEKPEKLYSLEPKATSDKGQLPDAIIGYFNLEDDVKRVSAVVELKGASISLDKPQKREGNMSPIQQAFKYKSQYRACPFVLVSNFYEFRLFQDNQLDYEIWTLNDLVNPDDDYFQFKKFYYLLNKENFTSKDGQTNTERLLSDIRVEQEEISKKFYAMYKDLRIELLRDIYHKNPDVRQNIEVGIEKAQKIIDRVVFICFCEDRGLLPDNTLPRTLAISQSSFGSLWNVLQGLFDAIDKGSEKLEIPDGYNGGLFKEDIGLNNLKISDEVLKKLAGFGEYNFSEDLSVNILGHIFEQSITDLEEIKNKVQAANDLPTLALSKRKKDGIFYTPDFVVDYIIENSLGTLLREKEQELKDKNGLKDDIQDENYEKRSLLAYAEYQSYLQNIKVLDPACGSGAFLVKVFDYLLKENERVGHILGGNLLSDGNFVKSILQNNIFGVDLNSESVEITKLSLWLKTAQKGKKLTTLDNNIKCGNSIVDDIEVVGNKAFSWKKEFDPIMKSGGFDVIVGNPPYVRQEIIKDQAAYLSKNYRSYSGKADLYVYFFEQAINLLRSGGVMAYISSGKFLEAKYGKELSQFLYEESSFSKVVDFGDLPVFEGISAYPIIFIAKKTQEKTKYVYAKIKDLNFDSLESLVQNIGTICSMNDFASGGYKISSGEVSGVMGKIKTNSKKFVDIFPSPTVGIKTGFNDGYLQNGFTPYAFGKGIKKYAPINAQSIIFPYRWENNEYRLIDENEVSGINLLREKKIELSNRAIIKEGLEKGTKIWYEFQQINKKLNFDDECIVYPNVSLGSNFTLSKGVVIDMTAFIIPSNSRYLLAVLNSSLFSWFMSVTAISRRGGYNEFKAQYVLNFPVKDINDEDRNIFSSLVEKVLELNQLKSDKDARFKRLVTAELKLDQWNRKLAKWWLLDFGGFIDALGIKKIPLTQKDSLLTVFEGYHTELMELISSIKKTEDEIDARIFDLYKLTHDEIKIVKNSVSTNSVEDHEI